MTKWKYALAAAAAFIPAIALVTPSGAQGDAQLPGQADVSRVTAGTYTTDPGHTLIGWRANHFGFNDYFGIFGGATGTLEIDPAAIEDAKVDITIPIANVITASEGLTGHLLRPGQDGASPDFFGPDPQPARFVSTSVESTGGTTANITGDLTLKGKTRPIVIAAEFTGAGKHPYNGKSTVGFEGRTVIKRSDFDINYGIPMVSDNVELDITVAFEM